MANETNLDMVRAMPPEKLASIIEDGCPPGEECPDDDGAGLRSVCVQHWIDWLAATARGR